MGAVDRTFTILPFSDRLSSNVVEPRELGLRQSRAPDFLSDQMGRSSLAVQGLGHEVSSELSMVNSVRKTCLALKSGQLQMDTFSPRI